MSYIHCGRCEQDKHEDEFPNCQRNKSGKYSCCKACKKADDANRRQRRKQECLTHYAGGEPRCSCCGVTHLDFLTIDHVNGGGRQHREQDNNFKQNPYAWLIRQKFPTGYRVLCYNCNCAIGVRGRCPHEDERVVKETT